MTPFRAASAAIARSLGRLPGLGGRRAQAALLAVCAWLFNPGYLMYRSTAIGARLSPLHDRFPIPAQAATSEARSLTLEKVALK
jgi:hypothetical protein